MFGGYQATSTDDYGSMLIFPTVMRTAPTSTITGTWNTSNTTLTVPSITRLSVFGACVYATTAGAGAWYMSANSSDDLIKLSSEL